MKKANLLSRAQMKNVMGGLVSVCETGNYHDFDLCFNCVLNKAEAANPGDPDNIDWADNYCSSF